MESSSNSARPSRKDSSSVTRQIFACLVVDMSVNQKIEFDGGKPSRVGRRIYAVMGASLRR